MLSIRAKLTLWYLGIAALVLGAFAVAIYFYLSRGLLAAIDTSLWNQAERIALATGHPSSNEEPTQPAALMLAPQFVSIVDKEGEVTDAILDADGHQVPMIQSSLEQAARDGKPQFDQVSISDDEHARIITWPARDEDGELFFVVVGQSLKDLERAQRQLLILLAVSNPIALLLASLGGHWIANKALRPVDRLTRAAERSRRNATSMSPRRTASGVFNSCEASAVNRRSRSKACSSLLIISLNVWASRPISS